MNTHVPMSNLFVEQTNVIKDTERNLFKKRQNPEFYLSLVMIMDILLLNSIIMALIGKVNGFSNQLGEFLILATLIWVSFIPFTNTYQVFGGIRLNLEIKNLFWNSVMFFGIISPIYYHFYFSTFEIHFLFTAFLYFTAVASLIHLGMRYYFNRTKSSPMSYAIVGGTVSNFYYLKRIFDSTYGNNIQCIGRFGKKTIKGIRNLGDCENIENTIKRNKIVKLLYINSSMSNDDVLRIMKLCRRHFVEFEVVPKEIDFFQKGIQVEQMAHLPIFCRKKEPLFELKNKILKRVFDIVFSLSVILLLLSWLYPILALLIKLESPGKACFVQKRTGYCNKPFNCYKFRTMRVNDQCDKLQATKDDARITRIGAILRKTNIDELPQFYNVLKGDMSVVGPRPHMLKHTEDYSKMIEQYMIRHEVKPGITGWAQVNGWRGPTKQLYQMAMRVEFDVNYIENWSLWFDLKCIFLTVFNMANGEENAF